MVEGGVWFKLFRLMGEMGVSGISGDRGPAAIKHTIDKKIISYTLKKF